MKKILLFTLLAVGLAVTAQSATKYDINVAGVEVTSDNASNIKGGDIKSGTVTFDASTKTLTMTNVTITRTGGSDYAIHNRSYKGLIVKFVGTCNLTTKARVIRFQSGGNWSDSETPSANECQLVASSGAVVNMTSTDDGAIYVRDFTAVWIKGPGTFNITGNKNGAIAGHGQWNATGTDLPTIDGVKFSNVKATVTGSQSCLLGLSAHFYAGANVTLKASYNSSYPVARDLYATSKLYNNAAILAPWGAAFSDNSFVLNGSKVYSQDVFISDNYALLLNDTNFPDNNFRNAMLALYPKGYLSTSELQSLTSLNVAGKSISSLTGIGKLTYLSKLYCSNNNLASLPALPSSLTYLSAYNNKLTSLPSLPSGLTYLDAGTNQLTSLPTLPSKLQTLYVNANKFTALNITSKSSLTALYAQNNTALTSLNCSSNALTTLNFSGCSALKTLYCGYNSLTSLGTLPTSLTELRCPNNSLTALPSLPTTLTYVNCSNNKLSGTLDMSYRSALKTLYCYGNPSLEKVYAYGSQNLTNIDAHNCSSLTTLDLRASNPGAAVSTLDLSGLPKLESLSCSNHSLTFLNLTACTSLKTLYAPGNKLTTIMGIPSTIETINVGNNKFTTLTITDMRNLKTLNVSDNTALTSLVCENNVLTSLNYSGCTALTKIDCENNQLTSLGALPTSVTNLICSFNNLASLPTLPSGMTRLECRFNKITSLSSLPSGLTYLSANNNKLTLLSVAGLGELQYLYCQNNNLTALSVQGCSSLKNLYCFQNQIKGAEMTSLINSLPTITSDSYSEFNVLYNTGEGNEITAEQVTVVRNKHWIPYQYNGSKWVEISGILPGDLNADGFVNTGDVSILYGVILETITDPEIVQRADLTGEGVVNTGDVSVLYELILNNN